ncbi:MAG: hypothetical protein ACXVH3_31585 [Solirubrobacteraceae bacterium]
MTLLVAGLCVTAIFAHAPAAVVPLISAWCVGCPTIVARQLSRRPAPPCSSAAADEDARVLADLARALDELPEVEHPLGL